MSLVKITYQLAMLISTKISNVALATQSPCAQSADKPYGLSKGSSAANALTDKRHTLSKRSLRWIRIKNMDIS
jgi:hypothetical protein